MPAETRPLEEQVQAEFMAHMPAYNLWAAKLVDCGIRNASPLELARMKVSERAAFEARYRETGMKYDDIHYGNGLIKENRAKPWDPNDFKTYTHPRRKYLEQDELVKYYGGIKTDYPDGGGWITYDCFDWNEGGLDTYRCYRQQFGAEEGKDFFFVEAYDAHGKRMEGEVRVCSPGSGDPENSVWVQCQRMTERTEEEK